MIFFIFTAENAVGVDNVIIGIPMCTPYGDMVKMRDSAIAASDYARISMTQSALKVDLYESEKSVAVAACLKMQKKMSEMEQTMMLLMKSCEDQVNAEKKQRDAHVQSIIAQHNHQLSELKRLQKAVAAKKSASASIKAMRSVTSPPTASEASEMIPDNISAPTVLPKSLSGVLTSNTRIPGSISKMHASTTSPDHNSHSSSHSHHVHPAHIHHVPQSSSQSHEGISHSHLRENVSALHKSAVSQSRDDPLQRAPSSNERLQRPNSDFTKSIDRSDTQYESEGHVSSVNPSSSSSSGTAQGEGANHPLQHGSYHVDDQYKSYYSTEAPLIYLRPHQIFDYQAAINDTESIHNSETYTGVGVVQKTDTYSHQSSSMGDMGLNCNDHPYRVSERRSRPGPRSHSSNESFSEFYNRDVHIPEPFSMDDSSSDSNSYLPLSKDLHPSYLQSDYSSINMDMNMNSHGYMYPNHQQQQQSEELDLNDAESR